MTPALWPHSPVPQAVHNAWHTHFNTYGKHAHCCEVWAHPGKGRGRLVEGVGQQTRQDQGDRHHHRHQQLMALGKMTKLIYYVWKVLTQWSQYHLIPQYVVEAHNYQECKML
ncbi:hypothetical protein E2C01_035251 [Portunus trituberculatus]|uniref:Uncharacterized protein n=1 Tax=Portunus trituberculatus TaxID=210409 RepID=A0A5B7F3R1_PORTR|nr:hypothetical protein [Portunus trituberculatus]